MLVIILHLPHIPPFLLLITPSSATHLSEVCFLVLLAAELSLSFPSPQLLGQLASFSISAFSHPDAAFGRFAASTLSHPSSTIARHPRLREKQLPRRPVQAEVLTHSLEKIQVGGEANPRRYCRCCCWSRLAVHLLPVFLYQHSFPFVCQSQHEFDPISWFFPYVVQRV